ncbi:unnamed protein product [Phytomonas sp. Hart1]|nr:unnamed protein product [Phytomonas sp. Hart1]|eukprot:CCW69010.1 unnamed protein product [Phytomonas sp. isolate Hart1]
MLVIYCLGIFSRGAVVFRGITTSVRPSFPVRSPTHSESWGTIRNLLKFGRRSRVRFSLASSFRGGGYHRTIRRGKHVGVEPNTTFSYYKSGSGSLMFPHCFL